MNRELREICNMVNRYIVLLSPEYSEDLRQNHEKYLADVNALINMVDSYFDKTTDLFQTWCNTSVQVFSQQPKNIFFRIKIYFEMLIVNHNLNKYSYKMSVCRILQDNLNIVRQRLIQYNIFS